MTTTTTDVISAYRYNCRQQVSGAASLTWDFDPGVAGTAIVTCVSSKTGTTLRNYKRRIAQGRNATTPFSGTSDEYSSEPALENIFGNTVAYPGTSSGRRKAAAKWSHGINSPPGLPPSGDVDQAANIASTKFYKQLNDTMTAFQGGVFLAELRETLHMIRNPAMSLRKKVRDAIENLRKHRKNQMRRPPSNRLKFLSDSWLEYSFGWSPLLNDLNEAGKVLDKRQNQLVQELIPIVGTGLVASTAFVHSSYISGSTNLHCDNRYAYRTHQVYAGAVRSTAAGTTLLSMNALGLSPRSFIPTLWEAMPYSFLIDYFSNVGNVLEAWSNQTTGLAWGRSTSRRQTVVESVGSYPTCTPYPIIYSFFHSGGKTIARSKSVNRSSISSAPIPDLEFELPGFGRKWINLSALATARRSLRFR